MSCCWYTREVLRATAFEVCTWFKTVRCVPIANAKCKNLARADLKSSFKPHVDSSGCAKNGHDSSSPRQKSFALDSESVSVDDYFCFENPNKKSLPTPLDLEDLGSESGQIVTQDISDGEWSDEYVFEDGDEIK